MPTPSPVESPRRATIYEVAQQAGVSIATVSRVLSDPGRVAARTRARVLEVITDLNYVPHGAARSLAARSHEAYGLVLPELRGPYYAELLTGFESAVAELGASVVVLLTLDKSDADVAVRRLAGRVDALALMGGAGVSTRTIAALRRKLPVVQLAAGELEGVETYSSESTDSARALTTHLLSDHARTRLLFVGSTHDAPDVRRRYDGFVQAHDAAGLQAAEPLDVALSEAAGREVAERLVRGDLRADGLVCANDELALAALQGLARAGVDVPGDVAVTGWDDMMASRYVTPGLTTVRQPVRELARLVARRLGDLLEDDASAEPATLLPTTVLRRGSCGCP